MSSATYLLVATALAVPAPDLGRTDLRWKLEKGKPFYQEMTTQTRQVVTLMGQEMVQTQKQTYVFRWTPAKQEADGSWVVKQKVEAVKMEIDIGGHTICYDSTANDRPANPLGDFFQALAGTEFTVTLDRNFRAVKVAGGEELLKKLGPANGQMDAVLQQVLGPESLKEMADSSLGFGPGKAVDRGETWERKTKLDMGPMGGYAMAYKYTYEGRASKLDRIKVACEVRHELPVANGNLPFQIVQSDLKSTGAKGELLFNRETGRLESSSLEMELKGKMTIAVAGQNTEIELAQVQKTTVKTLDDNPLKK